MSILRELITTVDSTPIHIEFKQVKRIHGLCAAVARRLNLSHEHVRQVAHGNRVSQRVTKELIADRRRREKALSRSVAA